MVRKNWGLVNFVPEWRLPKKKCTFSLSVNVFSTKVLTGDTIFTSPNGDGTAILRGHPSHAKVSPLAVQRRYLHLSVILRPWVMVRPRESNPRPPALQSNTLTTELILPWWFLPPCTQVSPIYLKMTAKAWNWCQRWLWTNGTRLSVWHIPSGKTELPFKNFMKFPLEQPKSCVPFTFQPDL